MSTQTERYWLSRRSFLKMSGLFTGAAILGGCSSLPASPATAPAPASPTTAPATQPPAAATGPVIIRHLHRGGAYSDKIAMQQIEAFQKANPDITVDFDSTPGDIYQKLLLEYAAGTAPDTWFADPGSAGLAWHKNIAVDLEPHLSADPSFNKEHYIDNAWVGSLYGGKRYGLPWDSGALLVAFNIDMFNEAGVPIPDPKKPLTWDDLLQIGPKLTIDFNGKHPDQTGFDPTQIKQYGFAFRTRYLFPWFWTNGAEFIDADGNMPIDSPEAIEAIQFAADLGTKHFISPSPAYQQSAETSLTGRTLAMHYNGVWIMGENNDAKLNWGALPFPMKKVPASYGHYSPLMLTSQSKKQDAAYKFISWCSCSKEGESILVNAGLLQPIRKDLVSLFVDTTQLPAKEYRQAYIDAFDPATFRYPGDKMGSFVGGYFGIVVDALTPVLDPVWSGKVQYKDVATDLRRKAEHALKTGELLTG
jgi:multiple sugar transport system substrate-binding protein